MANKNLLKANPLAMAAKTAGAAKKKLEEEERKKRAQQTAKAVKSPVSMAVKSTADTAKKAAKATKQTSEKAKQEKSKVKAATRTNYLARTGGALSKNQDKTSGFVQQRNPLTLAQANAATGLTSRDLVNTAKAGGIEPDRKKARQDNARDKRELEAKRKADASAPLSKYDKKLPAGSQDTIREASREWQKANAAGDETGKTAAHAKAERARSFAGYSGGSTGWDYISPELSKEEQRKLTPQGQKALKKAKLDWEAANAAGDEAGKEAAAKRGQEVRAAKGYRAGGTPGLEYTDAHGRTLDVMTPEEREKWKEQTAAAWKATGTGLLGSVLSAAETAGQATRNRIQANQSQWDTNRANSLDHIRDRLRRAQRGESGEDVETLQRLYDSAMSAQERINRRWANPRSDIVDPNLPGQRLMEKSQEYTAQALEGKSGLEKLLTQAGISIGQNLPSMGLAFVPGVGPALGAGLMGAQAAGAKSYELNQRGISPGESLARGLVSGGIEAATEYLPIKSLLNIVKGKGGQNVLKSLASQAGIEATEEGAAYVGNYLSDKAAQDPEAAFDLQDLAENAAVGAISGAVFGGAGGAVNAVARARSNARQNNPLLRTIDRLSGAETAQEAAISPEASTPAQVQEQSAEEALQARERDYTQRADDWTRRATQARTEQERAAIMEEFDVLLQEEQAISRERTRLRQDQAAQARQAEIPNINEESEASPFLTRSSEGSLGDEAPLSIEPPTRTSGNASQPENTGGSKDTIQQDAPDVNRQDAPILQADTSLFDRRILSNLNQARKSFIAYARDHFPKIVRNEETGKAIKISRNGIDKFLSGRIPYEKYATGFYIPELIQRAKYVSKASDAKGREFISGYEYYEAPIRVDGRDYTAYIRVRNTDSGNSYYGHTIGEIDQIKIEPPARVEAESATEPVYARNGSMESSARADAQGASNPVNAIDDSINSIQQEPAPVNSESAPYSVGAAPAGFDPYTRAINEYGAIEPGENPARIVDVPRSMTGEDRVRRFARTAMEAEITSPETREQIAQGIVENGFSYRPNKDKDSLDRAYKTIEEKGVEGALNQWQDVVDGNRRANKDDMVLAQALYVNAERTGDSSLAAQLAAQIAAEGTISGQNVQALRLLKQATPEGRVYYMRKIVGKLNEDLAKKKRVDKLTEDESIQLDNDLLQAYLEAEDSQAQTDALNAIYDDVARQMDPTAGDVLNAWRYFAMLGNPRTHIRNVLGNVIFGTVRNASNELSSVLQRGLIRDSAQRTRAVVSTPAARAFAQADYQEMKDALSGNKYNSDLDEIRRRVQNNALGPLSFLSKANSWALSAEDNLFKRLEYTRSLASYITAHGWDPANMTRSQLQAARTHAMNDALEATFQEASQVASAISRFEQTNALTRVAVGGAFPFKGVPINIAKEGFRYSPAGLMKAITADAAKVKRGEMTAADMIDNLSSGLTGTGIAMLGYWLSSLGMVTAGAGEDDKENLLDMANGSQNYSLNLGDWSYTIDWAAPAVLPLFIGAEFETMRNGQREEDEEAGGADQRIGQGLQALGRMFEPMLDMTVLSGVSSTIQSATYSQGNPLTAVGGNLIQNFGGQVIPTLLGQIARTVDPVRRSTYTDKDSGIPTSIQRFIQTQQNKIPGLSQRNVPYLNVWGEETVNENPLLRALQNFVSPGYIARRTTDGLSDELKRLNSLGYEGVLPSMRQKGQSIDLDKDGEKERLTRDQWETWQRSQGQTAKTLLNDLLSSQSYQNMTDDEKAAAVKRTLDYSKESGKLDAGGSEEGVDKWVLNAREYARDYGGGSPQGFFDAYNRRAELGKTDYDKGIQQGLVEDYINSTQQSQAAKNYLLDAIKVFQQIPANSGNYNKAKAQGYTDPEEISALLRGKKSADTNGNGNYTQKELSDYIKSQTTDPAEQERLWNVYKNSNWKKTWAQVSSGSSGKRKSSTKKSKGKGTFYLY